MNTSRVHLLTLMFLGAALAGTAYGAPVAGRILAASPAAVAPAPSAAPAPVPSPMSARPSSMAAPAPVPAVAPGPKPRAYSRFNKDPFAPAETAPPLPSNMPGLPGGREPHMVGMPGVPGIPGMQTPGNPEEAALDTAKATGQYLGVIDGERAWRMDGILYFEKTEDTMKKAD